MTDVGSSPRAARWRALWRNSGPTLWVTALVLVAFVLRTARLDFQPLWWDEGWTVYFATADIPAMVARTAIDIHPPFYYLLLHFWVLVTGASVTSVRLFSVMAGTLSVPLVYVVGRRLFGRTAAVLASLVMALAPFHVYYSQEARMYALVTLLVLASVYVFLRLLETHRGGGSGRRWWALYLSFAALAMYTQYYAAFIPLALSVFIIVRFGRYGGMLSRWVAAHALLLVLYLPWLFYAGPKLASYVENKLVKESDVSTGLWSYLIDHVAAFSIGHPSDVRRALSWLAVVLVALAVLGVLGPVVARWRRPGTPGEGAEGILLAVTYMLVPLGLGYVVNLRYPFTSPGIERLFLLSAPAFFLLVGAGLYWLRELWRVPAAVLLAAVVGTSALPLLNFYTFERYAGEDYRPVVERVQAFAQPEDVIVAVHPWQLGYFRAYCAGEKPSLYLTPKQATDVTSEQWAADRQLMVRDLDQLLSTHHFLWFPAHQTLGRIVESDVESYLLESHYPILSEWYSESTRLSCFARAEQLQIVETRTDFGGKVSLDGYGVSSAPVEAGRDAALVDLRWAVDDELPGRHQMVLRLVDDAGREWAVEDTEPRRGLLPFHEQPVGSRILDHQSMPVPAGTPPGLYWVELGLYRLDTGEWLEVRDPQGVPQGVYKRLGVVEVLAPASPPPDGSLSVQYPAASDSASGLRFLGFSLGAGSFQPGQTLELTLFWKALRDVSEDYRLALRLEGEEGRSWTSVEGPLATEAYPTSSWGRGQLARGIQSMMIPAGIPSGQYRLVMSLHSTADGSLVPWRRWLVNCGYERLLGTVSVQGRTRQTSPPTSIAYPLDIRIGDAIQLLGYDVDKLDPLAGENVHLTLYWHALAEVDGSYTVFNHVVDHKGRIWGQKDGVPATGSAPTSGWIAGEYVVDEYDVFVYQDTSPGEYLIETGMYDPHTMLRLPVFDTQGATAGDRVLLEATPLQVR